MDSGLLLITVFLVIYYFGNNIKEEENDMFIPFPFYSSSNNCKTLVLSGVGYRNETYCGSGVRSLSEIIEYERFELENADIDYFCRKYNSSNNDRYWYDEIIAKTPTKSMDILGFVSKTMSIPEERLGGIWVTSSPFNIANLYCDKWEQDAISLSLIHI